MRSITWLIAQKPVCCFTVIVILTVLFPILLIPFLNDRIKHVEHAAQFTSDYVNEETFLSVKRVAESTFPINSSVINLAKVLHSSLNVSPPSLSEVQAKVAPYLYLALKMLPISQVTFIGFNGVLYSYYIDGHRTFVTYANASSARDTQNASIVYNCHTEPVDDVTGGRKRKGRGFSSDISINSSWFQEASKSSNAYPSLRTNWGKYHEQLLLSTATMDGVGLISLGLPVKSLKDEISRIKLQAGELYLVGKDGTMLAQTGNLGIKINDSRVLISGDSSDINITCEPSENPLRKKYADIRGSDHMVYCSPFDIAGIPSASVMVFPGRGLVTQVQNLRKQARGFLTALVVTVFLSACFFVPLIINLCRREIVLSASLLKQMESTQEAERKTMNKSSALDSASHDIRSTLAAIDGLITCCLGEVNPNSDLHKNLRGMRKYGAGLIDLLNSILDVSKIEAGKMQLKEDEFDLVEVLEEAANLYYPIAKEKSIDVILDTCDRSVLRHSLVKGDRGKFKQILNNLIHNAIKFTSEGGVTIRAWMEKPSLEKRILSPIQDPIEFVFEVDDTGKGIPRDKHKSVFENFIQVQGTEYQGTGLGLGIVQLLVHFMGGGIGIKDKDSLGERGTCFRFNVFFSKCETLSATFTDREGMKLLSDYTPAESSNHEEEMNIMGQAPSSECSHIVLFIEGVERRKMLQKFFQSIGTKVWTLESLEHLGSTLKRIKSEGHFNLSCSGNSDFGPFNGGYSGNLFGSEGYPRPIHGTDNVSPHLRTSSRFVLIILDFGWNNFGDDQFMELCSILEHFKRDTSDYRYKVVWLYTPNPLLERRKSEQQRLAHCDVVMGRPLHGSRLYEVLRLLPEFGGAQTIQGYVPNHTHDSEGPSARPTSSTYGMGFRSGSSTSHQDGEIQPAKPDTEKPLLGKKVLVAEDMEPLQKVARVNLNLLGAEVEFCDNGSEAVELVRKGLEERNQNEDGASKVLPYEFIFMDCQMPIMNGYEATRQIRMEERRYNVHIPIIALTGNEGIAEQAKTKQAGMDSHIVKPLKRNKVLEAIHSIS